MKEISLKNLKEYLKQRSKEDLINEISGLFTRFENDKRIRIVGLGSLNATLI